MRSGGVSIDRDIFSGIIDYDKLKKVESADKIIENDMLDKKKFYINGEWVNPYKKNDCEVINPCNEDPFAIISLGSKEDTDLAVKAAKTAFETCPLCN